VLSDAGRDEVTDESPSPSSIGERRERSVEAAFATSDDGLGAAWRAHGDLVYGFCTRTLDRHRAHDATQEVFITAWRRREHFDPERGSLAGWLMGIARHKVLGVLRSEGRHPLPIEAPADRTGPGSEDHVDRVADRLLVAHALSALPERSRAAVSLSFMEGRTHEEIAEELGLPLGTVKSDIRRGLERLRRHLVIHDG
jgi:RNA polymerase sigma-70 factor (ECF subfamily)